MITKRTIFAPFQDIWECTFFDREHSEWRSLRVPAYPVSCPSPAFLVTSTRKINIKAMTTSQSTSTLSSTKKRKALVSTCVSTYISMWVYEVLRKPLISSRRSPAQVRCHRSKTISQNTQISPRKQRTRRSTSFKLVCELSTDEQEIVDQHRLRTLQAKCLNCQQIFFCAHGISATSVYSYCSQPIPFCCLDCRTSYEYRAKIQQAIDRQHYVKYYDENVNDKRSDDGLYMKPSLSSTRASTCPMEKDV